MPTCLADAHVIGDQQPHGLAGHNVRGRHGRSRAVVGFAAGRGW